MKLNAHLIAMCILAALAGCISPYRDSRIAPAPAPLDFAVQFNVRGAESPADPLRQNAQYLVQPDRKYRAATGQGAVANYFPPPTRTLSPQQYVALYDLIHRLHLDANNASGDVGAPTLPPGRASPAEVGDGAVIYELTITANDRAYRWSGTPEQFPDLTLLLSRLLALEDETARLDGAD